MSISNEISLPVVLCDYIKGAVFNMNEVSMPANSSSNKPRKIEFPHVFVILFALIVIMAVLTYMIPAGEYEREVSDAGETVVVDGTYHTVDSNPTGFFGIFQAVHEGMIEGAGIIFFIFIVGGAFGILNATKAMKRGLVPFQIKWPEKKYF